MKTFKTYLAESLKRHIDSFIQWGDSDDGKKHFGAKLSHLHKEPGSCSDVSNALCDHLKKHGIKASMLTAHGPTNKKWLDSRDDTGDSGSHTVVRHGNNVIDLTRGQFEKDAPRVHIQKMSKFRKEWSKVDQ